MPGSVAPADQVQMSAGPNLAQQMSQVGAGQLGVNSAQMGVQILKEKLGAFEVLMTDIAKIADATSKPLLVHVTKMLEVARAMGQDVSDLEQQYSGQLGAQPQGAAPPSPTDAAAFQ